MPFPALMSSKQYKLYEQFFKVHFMPSVLTLGFIFIDKIEPCRFEIQSVSLASFREVLKFEPRVISIDRSCRFSLAR